MNDDKDNGEHVDKIVYRICAPKDDGYEAEHDISKSIREFVDDSGDEVTDMTHENK